MIVTHISARAVRPGDAAKFNVEISPDLTLHNIRLRRTSTGIWHVYPQSSGSGRRSASFSPALSDLLTELGLKAAREHGIDLQ